MRVASVAKRNIVTSESKLDGEKNGEGNDDGDGKELQTTDDAAPRRCSPPSRLWEGIERRS